MSPYRPVLRTQTDVQAMWRHLIQPLGFGRRSLWLVVIDDEGRPLPAMTEIADCDPWPPDDFVEAFGGLLAQLAPARIAVLCSRPGHGPATEADLAYARAVHAAASSAGVDLEPVHLAHDEAIVCIAPDDLAA